jgi:hypothetical protein
MVREQILPAAAFFVAVAALAVSIYQARLARISAEMQNRAYISVKTQSVKVTPGQRPEIAIELLNSGKTPAYAFNMRGGCLLVPWPLPGDFKVEDKPDPSTESDAIIAPGNSMFLFPPCASVLSESDIAALNGGSAVIIVAGFYKYRDAFKSLRNGSFRSAAGGIAPIRDGKMTVLYEREN